MTLSQDVSSHTILFTYLSFISNFVSSYLFTFDRFSKVTEEHDINDVNDEEEKIKRLLNVVVTVTMSLQKAIDLHDTSFQESVF